MFPSPTTSREPSSPLPTRSDGASGSHHSRGHRAGTLCAFKHIVKSWAAPLATHTARGLSHAGTPQSRVHSSVSQALLGSLGTPVQPPRRAEQRVSCSQQLLHLYRMTNK